MSTTNSILCRIVESAERLTPLFSHEGIEDKDGQIVQFSQPDLILPRANSKELSDNLLLLGISQQTANSLVSLYEGKLQQSQHRFREIWKTLLTNAKSSPNDIELLQKCFRTHYSTHDSKLKDVILNAVSKCIDDFKQVQNESTSPDEGDDGCRGHSRLAIAILEKAYAHTTNISRSEKLKLSEATKLQPRQVTIWFQNRRNRKIAPKLDLNNAGVQALPDQGGCFRSVRKRKDQEPHDGYLCTPSQRRRLSSGDISLLSMPSFCPGNTSRSASFISSIDDSPLSRTFEVGHASRSSAGYSTEQTSLDGSAESVYDCDGSINCRSLGNISFDEQVQQQRLASCHDNASTLLFNEHGTVQLDMDDLQLDLDALGANLAASQTAAFVPSLLALATQPARQSGGIQHHVQPSLHPESPAAAGAMEASLCFANRLAEESFSATRELARIRQQEEWSCKLEDIVLYAESEDGMQSGSEFISLGSASSSQRSPSYEGINVDTSGSSRTPDAFDFTLTGLGIDRIVEQSYCSFTHEHDAFEAPVRNDPMLFQPGLCEPTTPTQAMHHS